MNETDTLLVRILAETDALWRPMRAADWVGDAAGVLHERRQRYATAGVQLDQPDRTIRSRMPFLRLLDAMQASGLLTHQSHDKRHHAKLTDTGEVIARRLVGGPELDEAHALLRRLVALEVDTPHGRLCSELWLANARNYGPPQATTAICEVEFIVLPALAREFAVSRSDMHGRVWYLATPAGRAFAAGPAPIMPPDLPEPSGDACDLYHDVLLAARAALRDAEPDAPGELGYVPLPCSIDVTRPKPNRKRRGAAR